MPSPEIKESKRHAPKPAPKPTKELQAKELQSAPRRVRLALLLAVAGAASILALAALLTAPARTAGVPSGQLVTLQADAPADPSASCGLFLSGPGGAPRLLVRDTTQSSGAREQILLPTLSPGGTQVAFEKQLVTAQNGADTQIWVMATAPGTASPPHLVIDLTQQKLKPIRGLAWDSDSSLLFLEDEKSYSVATETDDPPLVTPLDLHGLTLAQTKDVSATGSPALTDAGIFAYAVQTPSGPQVLTQAEGRTALGPAAAVFALSPDGGKIAFVPPAAPNSIRVYSLAARSLGPDIPVRSGWPAFGPREITALRWSSDGTQLAYSVRKASAPEEALYLATPATGQTAELLPQVARAAWDWGK